MKKYLINNPIELIFGFTDEKAEFFRKFINKILKFENAEDFFKFEEKKFKYVANKMIKKIAKLYDYIDRDKKVQESIIDWDLHHLIKNHLQKNTLIKELKYSKNLLSSNNTNNGEEKNYIKRKIYKKR